jgi:hypothetical protein
MLGRRWRQQTTLDLDAICPNNDLHDTVAIALLGTNLRFGLHLAA